MLFQRTLLFLHCNYSRQKSTVLELSLIFEGILVALRLLLSLFVGLRFFLALLAVLMRFYLQHSTAEELL